MDAEVRAQFVEVVADALCMKIEGVPLAQTHGLIPYRCRELAEAVVDALQRERYELSPEGRLLWDAAHRDDPTSSTRKTG